MAFAFCEPFLVSVVWPATGRPLAQILCLITRFPKQLLGRLRHPFRRLPWDPLISIYAMDAVVLPMGLLFIV